MVRPIRFPFPRREPPEQVNLLIRGIQSFLLQSSRLPKFIAFVHQQFFLVEEEADIGQRTLVQFEVALALKRFQNGRVGQHPQTILIEADGNQVLLLGNYETAGTTQLSSLVGPQRSVDDVQASSCQDLQFWRPAVRHVYLLPDGAIPTE